MCRVQKYCCGDVLQGTMFVLVQTVFKDYVIWSTARWVGCRPFCIQIRKTRQCLVLTMPTRTASLAKLRSDRGGFTTVMNFDRSDQVLICDNAFNSVKS